MTSHEPLMRADRRVVDSAPRRVLSARQADRLDRLTDAAVEELRAHGYEGLTVRSVAARCQVAPATAYAYFASKDHLVTEIFWRRLRALPEVNPHGRAPEDAVIDVVRGTASIVADDPAVAAACSVAVLAQDPEVSQLRDLIGAELLRRINLALGYEPPAAMALSIATHWSGAFLMMGMGYVTQEQMLDELERGIRALLR